MRQELFILFFMFLVVSSKLPEKARYRIRKGGKIDVLHKQMLQKWRTAFRKNYRDKSKNDEMDHIIVEMDSYIKPRFG
uniref:Uncharacterized protein n=1 Tax=Wuchereria bancrofti TaxID=6293 RepID=A0AAF5PUZ0_WUCBA